jgi:hypothetical protein
MTAVRVACGVGVVLEDIDLATNALLFETFLGSRDQTLEDALPRLVVGDYVLEIVAFRGGVLRMGANVEIETCTIFEKDVGRPTPRDDPTKEVASDLIGAETTLPTQRARHAIFVLQPKDPAVHAVRLNRIPTIL